MIRHIFRIVALAVLTGSTAWAYQERLVESLADGSCQLRLEADDQSQTLRLRVLPEAGPCQASPGGVRAILAKAFARNDLAEPAGRFTSLFLGRLVSYPWLSTSLAAFAAADPGWDRRRGRPAAADLHGYVSKALARREIVAQFEEPFGDSGYRVVSVSVEKVLVSRFREIAAYNGPLLSGKVPWDAMVWLNLEQSRAATAHGGAGSQP